MTDPPENKNDLIERLSADLQPVRRFSVGAIVAMWLAIGWAFVAFVTFSTGDLRPGVVAQLQASPRFLLEYVLGAAVGVVVYRLAVLLAIPGATSTRRAAAIAVAMLSAWFGLHLYGLVDPALEPSMIGKRPHCFVETFVFSSMPIAFGLWLLLRRLPLARGWTGALVGFAAASMPAPIMQIACMCDPRHILQFHLMPVLIVGGFGALSGWLGFKKP